ncbi:leucyl/phenylalanyl-tRNA--protein transferase [Sphingomonas quercus]|uniref:Leucyl/phenylalanyl-tRNA--protein transferase n=1 Tax=Sphingomonas quercus TaxID=2842451 RepID=A0ABS6BP07_9SPHN|nr:leucyl/phenylalanyl-tRNA--protein transferase [Sphingomonas quercus]MBU3078940.1 leucyl/phenylalanyl-tRNA--protein transferase [Sphingomonas quercus]
MNRARADRDVSPNIDPDLLLGAYSIGVFPMADSREAPDIFWVEPKQRGILPLDGFRLARSLAKTLKADRFEVTADRAFGQVVSACAERVENRPDTWINPAIEDAYGELHRRGNAHSIECWQGDELVGGLYGVSLGAAFFGESMFSRARDASKIALAHLVARLRVGRYRLLDCQFITDHLASMGAVEVSRAAYRALLDSALVAGGVGPGAGLPSALVAASAGVDFAALDKLVSPPPASETVSGPISGCVIAQLLGQTS